MTWGSEKLRLNQAVISFMGRGRASLLNGGNLPAALLFHDFEVVCHLGSLV